MPVNRSAPTGKFASLAEQGIVCGKKRWVFGKRRKLTNGWIAIKLFQPQNSGYLNYENHT